MKKRLPFQIDPSIVHHIIYSQAGTLSKALIELVMNSIDAGCSRIDMIVACNGFRVSDDGRGFRSKEEVLNWFGRFGTPHDEGDATFGRFRLGRGQIMAFASTIWASNRWRMTVDVPSMGYNYELEEAPKRDAAFFAGCRIEGKWYDALDKDELRLLLLDIVDMIRWTSVPVTLNGKTISTPPSENTWMVETEDAWMSAQKEGAVGIFNQGVLVTFDAGHKWGAGGTIVTKKAIALNVSRSEILRQTCPVWQRIQKRMRALCSEVAQMDDGRIDENARAKWAQQLMAGGPEALEVLEKDRPVITLVPMRHVSFGRLPSGHDQPPLTVLEFSPRMPEAELLQKMNLATVVAPITLTRFRCRDVLEFAVLLRQIRKTIAEAEKNDPKKRRYSAWFDYKFVEFDALAKHLRVATDILDPSKLKAQDLRIWRPLYSVLSEYVNQVMRRIGRGPENTYIRILLGSSETTEAWTDGRTYIAINRKFIDKIKSNGLDVLDELIQIVNHEMSHSGDSIEAGHDEAFFQRFHDLTIHFAQYGAWIKDQFLQRLIRSLNAIEARKPVSLRKRTLAHRRNQRRWLAQAALEDRKRLGGAKNVRKIDKKIDLLKDVPLGFIENVRSKIGASRDRADNRATPNWKEITDQALEEFENDFKHAQFVREEGARHHAESAAGCDEAWYGQGGPGDDGSDYDYAADAADEAEHHDVMDECARRTEAAEAEKHAVREKMDKLLGGSLFNTSYGDHFAFEKHARRNRSQSVVVEEMILATLPRDG